MQRCKKTRKRRTRKKYKTGKCEPREAMSHFEHHTRCKQIRLVKAPSKKVLEEGLEPSLHAKLDPKSSASANSATRANQTTAALRKHRRYIVVTYFKKERKCQNIFQESNEPTELQWL